MFSHALTLFFIFPGSYFFDMLLVLYVPEARVRQALHKQADFLGYYHFSFIDATLPSAHEYFQFWCDVCQVYQRVDDEKTCPTCSKPQPHFGILVKARNTIVIAARLDFLQYFLQQYHIVLEVTNREIQAQTRRHAKRILRSSFESPGRLN